MADPRQELMALFPALFSNGKNGTYLDDLTEISTLLQQFKNMELGLRALERAMTQSLPGNDDLIAELARKAQFFKDQKAQKKALQQGRPFPEGGWMTDPDVIAVAYRRYDQGQATRRMLTRVLSAAERQAGFGATLADARESPGGAASMFMSLLDVPTFNAALRQGASWKDLGAQADHGEYTHRIQWYVINVRPRLKTPAPSLFAFIADAPQAKGKDSLWDVIFDRSTSGSVPPESPEDCRRPENLLALLEDERRMQSIAPVLCAWLNARHQKRKLQELDYDIQPAATQAYLQQKWQSRGHDPRQAPTTALIDRLPKPRTP